MHSRGLLPAGDTPFFVPSDLFVKKVCVMDNVANTTATNDRRTTGVAAILRAFPRGLERCEAEELYDQLIAGEISFGTDDLIVTRDFAADLAGPDDPVVVWLAGTGRWRQRLLATIANDRPRRIWWSAKHGFMYVVGA